MKLNGVGKSGIICLFIGNVISLIVCLVILTAGLSVAGIDAESGSLITVFAIIAMILPLLVIIFGALAMIKGSNGLKIACGVLGLISIVFVWVAFFAPAILALVGGILTLCGKFKSDSSATIVNYQTA